VDALILEISTRGLHRYETLARGVTRVGRALDNDIILSDPTVAPHHLQILHHPDDSIELINLAEVNPTRVDAIPIDTQRIGKLPVNIEIGRVQVQLLPRDFPVAATRSLAGNGKRSHLFGPAYWALVLALLCWLASGLEFYVNAYSSFKWGELVKHLLRETTLTIGAFVLALSILERLLVNRWEIRQMLTSVCLVYLLFMGANLLADSLDYLLSAHWPSGLLYFGWYLALIPVAIFLYLIHISHLPRERSILLALLIASPIALPAILQSPQMQALFDNFSNAASYHNQLSYTNWHLRDEVSIDEFIEQAKAMQPGKPAD
jgi:hypothetical protein